MADDRLRLRAELDNAASAGVKRLGKDLAGIKPSHGMAQAQKWFSDFRRGADQTVKTIQPVAGMMNSIGVGGLAASLSIGEMVKQFKELADSTLTMKELGREASMSATEIARLQYAASKLHVDPAAMNGAIGSWSSKMVEFRMHTSVFYRDLMRQNADVAAKIQNDSPVDALKDALDFISRIKDPQIQKRWADDAGLGDLAPMFAKGPQGLSEAFAEAGREVKPISKELQEAADRFNEATNRFSQTWTNFKNDLGPSVLDPMSAILDKLDVGLKAAAASPADAVTGATIIAGSFAAFWARARILRALSGGATGRAAGELAGAAQKQTSASTSLLEAATALKEAAAELRSRGGAGGNPGGAPEGTGKPGESSPGYASLFGRGLFAALQSWALVEGMPDQLKKAETDNAPVDPQVGREADWGDRLRRFFHGGATAASHPDDDRLSRARAGGFSRATDTDGNALRRNDDALSPVTAQELFQKVKQGSKEGIVAGLREMAQEQELAGGGNGGGLGGKSFGAAGTPSVRYGHQGGGTVGPYRGAPRAAKGALSANQQEAYAAALKEGLTPTAAHALVANMSGESLANPRDSHWDRTHNSQGIVQWDPTRSSRIQAQFGKEPKDMSVTEQTRAAIWEMRTRPEYAATNRALQGSDPDAMLGALVRNYERPADADAAIRTRQGFYAGFKPNATPSAIAPVPTGTSATAISDAEVFAARQRMAAGGSNPKDKALVDSYLKQQNAPKKHASGGSIRGPGGPRSDSIFAMLSNGEFVVNARDAERHRHLLHAINDGGLPAFADGGLAVEGAARRRSWLDFFKRPAKSGGMGASYPVGLGATAMMMGESGRNLNPRTYGWDVNGPSGGTAQWHDVTKGPGAGKVHRLSDMMTMAMQQHADWKDVALQQAWWRHEATGPLAYAWNAMRKAHSAAGALKAGIDKFEVPADKLGELHKRLPNIVRLAQEAGGGAAANREMDPLEVNIRHHPVTGRPIVTARSGKGVKLGIRTAPTMRAT